MNLSPLASRIQCTDLAKAIISTLVEEVAAKTLALSEKSEGEKGSWCARQTPKTAEPSSE